MARVTKVQDKKTGKVYAVLPKKGTGKKVNIFRVAASKSKKKYA